MHSTATALEIRLIKEEMHARRIQFSMLSLMLLTFASPPIIAAAHLFGWGRLLHVAVDFAYFIVGATTIGFPTFVFATLLRPPLTRRAKSVSKVWI